MFAHRIPEPGKILAILPIWFALTLLFMVFRGAHKKVAVPLFCYGSSGFTVGSGVLVAGGDVVCVGGGLLKIEFT